ncbi:hypothetical protein HDU93_001778 [Gonapodya sp. JEL0774]|nr:hypothetical protein HDU93_001778 [Gonapodya sp. JEL0774]
MRVLSTHSDTANSAARLFLPRMLDLQALVCAEPIEQLVNAQYDGNEVKGYWIGKPVDHTKDVILLYIHGGSFIGGHALQCCHALGDLIRIMSKQNGLACRVFSVDYPLAPEVPYPGGLDACVRAVKWLIESLGSKNVFLVGDSAGGNLALATLLRMRDTAPAHQLHKILGCIPISPYVDFLGPRKSTSSTEVVVPSMALVKTGNEEPQGDQLSESMRQRQQWSVADNLSLNAGRCAIRYYLGTKGLNWYNAVGGWPNPWDKSQWDNNWLHAWDTILGITDEPEEGASRGGYTTSMNLATHDGPSELPATPTSPSSTLMVSPKFTHRRSVSSSPSPLVTEASSRPSRLIWAQDPYLSPPGRGMTRSTSSPSNVNPNDGPDGLPESPTRRRPPPIRRSASGRSTSLTNGRRSSSIVRKDIPDSPLALQFTEEPMVDSEFETDGEDKHSGSEDSDPSSPNTAVSSPAASPPLSVHGRLERQPVKRFSSIAERVVFVRPEVQSGVPFPGLSNLKTPYYLNPELSNYDLERIYITLALSPYVSPSRANTFDNLPAILFVVGRGEAVYNDVMRCVTKARKSIIAAEKKLTAGELAARPRTFGRVDVMERPLGEHTYLLLPEALVGGKGMDGLRDIATWMERTVKEKTEWPAKVHVFRATRSPSVAALRLDTKGGRSRRGSGREGSVEREVLERSPTLI